MHPWVAKQQAKKRCKRGHQLQGRNIYVQVALVITKKFGRRVYFLRACRKCRAAHSREWRSAHIEQSREQERARKRRAYWAQKQQVSQ